MIEYNDKKLGYVKVLNVTEARASFATMLGDVGAHYIITKNNKPLRVVIDYQDFERLKSYPQEALENQGTAQGNQCAQPDPAIEKATEIAKRKKAESVVRGIIETNLNLAQEKTPAPSAPRKQFTVEEVLEAEPKRTQTSPAIQKPKEEESLDRLLSQSINAVKETKEDDYFLMSEDENIDLEIEPPEMDLMLADEETETPLFGTEEAIQEQEVSQLSDDEFVITETANENENTEDYFAKAEQEPVVDLEKEEDFTNYEISEEDITPDSLSAHNEAYNPYEAQESIRADEKQNGIEEENLTPEQKEYFAKYKKLYEGFDAQEEETQQIETSFEQIEESVKHFASNSDQEEEKDSLQAQAQQRVLVNQTKNKKIKSENESELPSLKDLLSELESERLSSDENDGETLADLSEEDIEDLVSRITYSDN